MNPEAQTVLDEILKKEPQALNIDEIEFLRARRSYLKKAQLEEFKDVIETQEKPLKHQTSDEETVKPHARTTK